MSNNRWLGDRTRRAPRSAVWAVVRFIVVVLIAFALSTAIDPYLYFGSPLAAQAVNAVLPVILVLLVWGLGGRAWVALVVEIVALGALRYADLTKVMDLNVDLVYDDFTVLRGLMSDPHLVLGFVHISARKVLAAIAAVIIIGLIAWFTRRIRPAGWKFRVACGALAVAAVVAIANLHAPNVIPSLQWQVYAQPSGAKQVGIAGNILLGRMTALDVNRKASPAAERAFWEEPLVRAAERHADVNGNGLRPDIVIVQSESLFMPSQLCGFPNKPLLPHIAAQLPDTLSSLHVPVFGGRTLQTEFEVLTGAPISFYPGSMFAYYELIHHPFDALPDVLYQDGYKTVAIHPNNRGFWRRDVAFPDMGFRTFQDINDFVDPADYSDRHLVSDESLVRAILAELDASDRPTFVMAISINNHGPWGEFGPKDDAGLGLPAKLHGEARKVMADYVDHAIDYDNAYGFLLDALARRGRPTVVVTYGDHMPALPGVYKQLCFKNGQPATAHEPPYRIWANFPMPMPPPTTSAYLLQGWLMHVAGLPLRGHDLANFLAGEIANDPRVSQSDRTRILDEYANIAAANVAARVPSVWGAKTVFMGVDRALPLLMKKAERGAVGVSAERANLQLKPNPTAPAHITFALVRGVASLSLRPYLVGPLACLASPGKARDEITVSGDGRPLYRAYVTTQTFRLAALDLQDVKRLSVTVADAQSAAGPSCASVRLKVSQMLCFSVHCNRPEPTLPADAPPELPSRILAGDPMAGDVARLATMTPLMQRPAPDRMINARWMLKRETHEQAGAVPFTLQADGQLFMPPAQDHGAWVDFNVTGLNHIDLSPRMRPPTAACVAVERPGKRVAVAKLKVQLDGKTLLPSTLIDPDYKQVVALDVRGGHTLRIKVDKGSHVDWCDWFSLGFRKLEGSAAPVVPLVTDANQTVATPAFARIPPLLPARGFQSAAGAVQRAYPSASAEAAMKLGYPLFLPYGADSARLTPFFPGTSRIPVQVGLDPGNAGYSLKAQGSACAFPMRYRLTSAAGKQLASGTYKGTAGVDLAGWNDADGFAVLSLRMAPGAKNNFGCNVVVTRR